MGVMSALDQAGAPVFRELSDWRSDTELLDAIAACLAAQRSASARAGDLSFESDPSAREAVSEDALRAILERGDDLRGVATEPEISNAISFNARNLQGTLMDREVARRRRQADRLVANRVRRAFPEAGDWVAITSGHFWYPPGGYMGWHTNSDSPGWRLYVTHAEEPGSSFFRYRDPESGRIVTSMDERWDVRLFRVSVGLPLWHAVYSETHRYSFGYLVRPRSWSFTAKWHLRRLAGAARMAGARPARR